MTAAAVAARRRSEGNALPFATRRRLFMLAMLLPALIYVIAISVWPISQAIWFSFFDYNLLRPHRTEFIGFENYVRLLVEPTGLRAITNTFIFTVSAVTIELALGLIIALLLWRDDRFNRITLALILVPLSITPLAVGLVFSALLAADFGLVGHYLAQWGITDPRGMFADPFQAMLAIIIIDVWQWTPLMALILLAGLKSLPGDVVEAAKVDGATGLQRLVLIVLPLLLPAIFLALVLRTMDAFRVFDSVFVATKGGPGDATNVLMYFAIKEGLEFFNIGYASAIATVTLACICVFAAFFVLAIRTAEKRMNA